MSHKVVQLVRRLASPAVASALAKEELCLALAAVAQLKPFLSVTVADTASSAGSSAVFVEPLARRSLRVIPQCSSQELKMIAQGASALQWSTIASSPFVVEALVQGLYRHAQQLPTGPVSSATTTAQRNGRVRLGDILAVAEQAMEAGHFFNATLYTLLTQDVERLLCGGPGSPSISAATAEELIAVVCAYLGETDGVALLQRLRAALPASTATSPGAAVLAKCAASQPLHLTTPTWSAAYTRWAQQRDALLASFTSAPPLPSHAAAVKNSTVDTATARQQEARHNVLHVIQRLLLHSPAATAAEESGAVSDEELVEALEAVKAHHIYDPVTLLTLDATLLRRLSGCEATPPAPVTATAYESSVYAQAPRFPRTLSMLRQRDEAAGCKAPPGSSEALQPLPAIQQVYRKALAGAFISEKDLFLVGDNINAYGADEVAMAAFIFACNGDISPNLIVILASATAALTVDGMVALFLATRHDRAGALRTVVEASLRDTAHQQRCVAGASVEALVALAKALSLPHTRWTAAVPSTLVLEAQLMDTVAAQLRAHVGQMLWASLLSVVRELGKLPGCEDLVRAACDRLADQLETSTCGATAESAATCLDVVEALQAGDVVSERLLDLLATALSTSFAPLSADLTGDDSAARHAALLRLASLELSYESPELAEVLAGVVQLVARAKNWDALPTELLVSAALFSFDRSNVPSFYAANFILPLRVLEHIVQSRRLATGVSIPLATAIVELLSSVLREKVDVPAAADCVEALLPLASALAPATAARLICMVHRKTAGSAATPTVPQEAFDLVAANLRGLPVDVFTSLCLSLGSRSFDGTLQGRLVAALPLVADQLSPHQLSQCIFGLGEMPGAGQRLAHQVMMEALADYVVDNVELFTSSRDIASLLHGFAKLQCTKRNLYSVLAKQVRRRCVRATLDFQSISFLLFAFGSAKFVDQWLVNFCCSLYIGHANELVAPDLLMALCGVSRMCVLNERFYWALGEQAARRVDEFPLQAQCELLHAYGALEQRHPVLAATLATHIAANVEALTSTTAAVDVLTSLWLMDYKVANDEAADAIVSRIARNRNEISSGDIVKLCSVITDTQWANVPLLNAIAARALELKAQERLEATVARAVLDTLASQLVFHCEAREELSQLARSVSKEVVQLSGEEQEQLNLLVSR
ncbi:hypothetical protein NQL31_001700 [Lotmaria passim]